MPELFPYFVGNVEGKYVCVPVQFLVQSDVVDHCSNQMLIIGPIGRQPFCPHPSINTG